MSKKTSWNLYGVKIVKQVVIEGAPIPSSIDEFYDDDDKQVFEESVMLVNAQSYEHAYKIAKKKSIESEVPSKNVYGQEVIWKFIKAVGCYQIPDNLVSGTEVYSCLQITDKNETADEFIDKRFSGAY